MIPFQRNDGGRAKAGYTGKAQDCVCRAIAITAARPYQEVYDALNGLAKSGRQTKKRKQSRARTGVWKAVYHDYIVGLGFRWVPTMAIGTGCRVHLKAGELPPGRLITRLSGHLAAVIDGTLHDTYDCSRGGTRCVYGYYVKESVSSEAAA
jgi:hypothetical protein